MLRKACIESRRDVDLAYWIWLLIPFWSLRRPLYVGGSQYPDYREIFYAELATYAEGRFSLLYRHILPNTMCFSVLVHNVLSFLIMPVPTLLCYTHWSTHEYGEAKKDRESDASRRDKRRGKGQIGCYSVRILFEWRQKISDSKSTANWHQSGGIVEGSEIELAVKYENHLENLSRFVF